MTIEVIFYAGKGTLMDSAVRVWTRSIFSHCELHFGQGHCFGADPENGVSWRLRQLENNNDWDAIPLPELDPALNQILTFTEREAGCAYDWSGIVFSEVLPFNWQSSTRWFCSELVTAALQIGGLLPGEKPACMSPGRVWERLRERSHP